MEMDFTTMLNQVTNAAGYLRDGMITEDDFRGIAMVSIIKYTDENFVYTGDIPVIAAS